MKLLLACCLVALPLKNLRVTSSFGYRTHPLNGKYMMHTGVDLRAKHDTVYAVIDGTIKSIGYSAISGIYIRLQDGDVVIGYGHLSQCFVVSGETVAAGDPIGISGATGRVTGKHLHFSISISGHYLDPLKFLNQYLINQDHE